MASETEKTSPNILTQTFTNEDEGARRKIALSLTVIARLMRNNFDRKVSALNVTRSQWAMIAVVSRIPGATQRVIAEHLEMSEASAGRLIDRLCAEGLLERRDRRDDRRARAVYLTDAAAPLLEQLQKIALASEDRMFNNFSDEEVDQLLDFMLRIYENVSRG
ncbi:MarR family winged helix-turn-helix transcriptional regulator [Novosphingobium pentaromativorans]|uniref:MarR family transcriptional regulator n=1 Tax=Novosphingobium pentaromativorans US6-1 TaxID=1088721 RepID=G6EI80_9SPHN|nr:MarR family transcriptional regulator [Novosphingobium pentaromativorans]AIT78710.1 MarR family transcriptional regulator [Novosphingobium pentaromativorans US6-1]EHJ58822.1 MarR family transcriptional regulator [Novosphingobium pentaromativorans US6-1]